MARLEDVAAGNGSADTVAEGLSTTEAAVYDRQIRLWGIEAQNKLRHSRVLLVGLKGLGAEVAKNLVLCGINSMQIIDSEASKEEDLLSNFFLTKDAVGTERAASTLCGLQALNPLVKLSTASGIDEVDFAQFSLVVFTDQPYNVMKQANEKCRSLGVRFFAASVYGWVGYALFDCNGHDYLLRKEKIVVHHGIEGEDAAGTMTVDDEEDEFDRVKVAFPSYEEVFNADLRSSQLTRRQKRQLPSSFFPIRALLRMDEQSLLTGDEDRDRSRLVEAWVHELKRAERSDDLETIQPEQFDYLFGPQLSPACAVLGGMVGQEAIKALTGGKLPYRSLLLGDYINSETCLIDLPFVKKP